MKIIDLFKEEKQNNATGGQMITATMRSVQELNYQKRAETLLADENCFKVYFVSKDV